MIRFPTRSGIIELSSDAGWILLFTLVILWFLHVAGVLR